MDIYQLLGWVGTVFIVGAYFLVSYKKLDSQSSAWQLMNLIGSICLVILVLHQKAWPAVALNVIWGAIAITALIKICKKKN